jgi:hypothetical protein
MIVGIRHLPLQHEVREMNSDAIKKLHRENYYDVARKLNLPPENRLVQLVYDAMQKGVKVLKTTDKLIIAYSKIIEMKCGIKVITT